MAIYSRIYVYQGNKTMPIYSRIYVYQGNKTEKQECVLFSWIVARALHSCELLVGYRKTLKYQELLTLDE